MAKNDFTNRPVYQNETKLANYLRAEKGKSCRAYQPEYESDIQLFARKSEQLSSRTALRDFQNFLRINY